MPVTAFQHFTEDIQRARELRSHAVGLPDGVLKDDIFRASWMMAVGAMDAYFCDAFADVLSRILNAKNLDNSISLSKKVKSISMPINTLLKIHASRSNWKWRSAARGLVEQDNVLSIQKIKDLFNHIMDDSNKILTGEMMEDWLLHNSARHRLVGISPTSYSRLSTSDKNKRKKAMADKLTRRYTSIIQRRHDCIHNCDRPKVALQSISEAEVQKITDDIEFLVENLDQHIATNLRRHLLSIGCSRTIVRQVGA